MKLLVKREADGQWVLRSPAVGWWCEAPRTGQILVAGDPAGRLEVLGHKHPLIVPEEASGRVVFADEEGVRRRAVAYGDVLLRLDASHDVGEAPVATSGDTAVDGASSKGFQAPSAGRFYARPSPEDPPFVAPGDSLSDGQVVGVIEVMKTFTQLHYQGAEARVIRVVPQDGDDIEQGDLVLELAYT